MKLKQERWGHSGLYRDKAKAERELHLKHLCVDCKKVQVFPPQNTCEFCRLKAKTISSRLHELDLSQ